MSITNTIRLFAAALCLLAAGCGGSGDDDGGSALDAAADVAPSTESAPTSARDPDAPPAWQPSTLPPEPPEFWVELDEMWESQREMRLEQTRQAQREADRQAEWEAMDWDEQSGCHVEDFRCVEAWHAATTTTTTAPPPTTRRTAPAKLPPAVTILHDDADPQPSDAATTTLLPRSSGSKAGECKGVPFSKEDRVLDDTATVTEVDTTYCRVRVESDPHTGWLPEWCAITNHQEMGRCTLA